MTLKKQTALTRDIQSYPQEIQKKWKKLESIHRNKGRKRYICSHMLKMISEKAIWKIAGGMKSYEVKRL